MAPEDSAHGPATLAVHAGSPPFEPGSPVVSPIVQSTTFFNSPEPGAEVLYTRYGLNPNHTALAAKLAALEGAESALALGSGMAASSMAVLSICGAGDHVVAARTLYGGTSTLLREELPRLGIGTSFVDEPGVDAWEAALQPQTRALFVEVPVNPTLGVPDIRPLAALARERGLPLLVDATFATPVHFRPLEHGATLVIHSATKYLGGHSDVTAGMVAGGAAAVEAVRQRMKTFGAALDPHAAWLLERGMKTLVVRVERHSRNALELARWLEEHPAVERVHYPGLERHPDHAVARELFRRGFGGMLAFVVRGGDEAALRVAGRFRLFRLAPSLGGVDSLVSLPRYTSHAAATAAERRELGIEEGFVRLSVGIEEPEDLRADLERALAPEL